ncbi:winged helix DNA-binding domain-containing protein [Lentzea sp. NBRC 105346]|uniref:winged helix DNA-binding domain-containing protein n=1 Tax=Lentzea sp. NBRC 105346 TaxID=3032205 RepID=UPI002557C6BF|nr:winged helix DNA-binding domain-containing protein [Lentzea sp. NBRC 105346]
MNRTLLARQLLLARQDVPVVDAITHLVGLQAQTTTPPYLALWSRLQSFSVDDLSSLIEDRTLVRMTLMRGTLHLVAAPDCAALRPVLQPMLAKGLQNAYGPQLKSVDLDELVAEADSLLAEGPLTVADLGSRLLERWPDSTARALSFGAQLLSPMVRVPPSGVWGQSAMPSNGSLRQWSGLELPDTAPAGPMIERYLRAFGPASAADIAAWSKLTGLRPHINQLDLVKYQDPNGRELLDVPDGELTDEDAPAPVRYLPVYDNLLLSHADRTRVMSDEHRKRWGATKNGVFPQTFLVDGFVRGTWEIEETKAAATLVLTGYAKVSKRDQQALSREGAALLKFVAPGKSHDFRFTPA